MSKLQWVGYVSVDLIEEDEHLIDTYASDKAFPARFTRDFQNIMGEGWSIKITEEDDQCKVVISNSKPVWDDKSQGAISCYGETFQVAWAVATIKFYRYKKAEFQPPPTAYQPRKSRYG